MNWLRRPLHKSRAERELDKELQFHLEQQIADGVAAGLSPALRINHSSRTVQAPPSASFVTQCNHGVYAHSSMGWHVTG
jgi:hypothetical protein